MVAQMVLLIKMKTKKKFEEWSWTAIMTSRKEKAEIIKRSSQIYAGICTEVNPEEYSNRGK